MDLLSYLLSSKKKGNRKSIGKVLPKGEDGGKKEAAFKYRVENINILDLYSFIYGKDELITPFPKGRNLMEGIWKGKISLASPLKALYPGTACQLQLNFPVA